MTVRQSYLWKIGIALALNQLFVARSELEVTSSGVTPGTIRLRLKVLWHVGVRVWRSLQGVGEFLWGQQMVNQGEA